MISELWSQSAQYERAGKNILVSPSVYAADFSNLEHEIARIPSADWIHVDIMDGMFVPNFSMGYPQIRALKKRTDKLLDVHLMIENPVRYIRDFSDAGADIITVHVESEKSDQIERTIKEIHERKKKAGLALSPGTPPEAVLPYLDLCDMVLVMTIYPGRDGQSLIPELLGKIGKIRWYIDRQNPRCLLEADGGINPGTVAEVVRAGANVIVSGNAVFGNRDADQVIRELLKIGENEYELRNRSGSWNQCDQNNSG